jgi:uncharacterized cupredoxin-like copper-binding protein
MEFRRIALLLLLPALALAIVASRVSASPLGTTAAPTRVTVTMTEFSFKLTKTGAPSDVITTIPHGAVIFTVVNKGKLVHDFVLTNRIRTSHLAPGQKFVLKATLAHGTYAYVCDLPRHQELGMVGTLTVK